MRWMSPRANERAGDRDATRSLRTSVALAGLLALAALFVVAVVTSRVVGFGAWYPRKASIVFGGVLAVVLVFIRHHPFSRFGAANYLTLTRAALMALLAASLGEPVWYTAAFAAACAAGLMPMLDGFDGRLARRAGMQSAFGARFDVEIDSLHVLVMSGLLWQFGKAGIWIWVGGVLRYAFVAAGWRLPWMAAELRPTLRGRVITIVHMTTVSIALAPFVPATVSMVATALSTAALVWSFAVDTGRLWRGEGAMMPRGDDVRALLRAAVLAGTFCVLSQLWTLPLAYKAYAWPQLATASLEVAVIFALLALFPLLRHGRVALVTAALLAVATMLVTTLRVAELGFQESLGRPLNPLLDVYLLDSLALLLTETLGTPLGQLAVAALALAPLLVGAIAFAAVRASQRALEGRFVRYGVMAACLGLAGVFVAQTWGSIAMGEPPSGDPKSRVVVTNAATVTLLQQLRTAQETARGVEALRVEMADDRFRDLPGERMLAGLQGVDVLLIFIEAYGRAAVDLPYYKDKVVPVLADFEARLAEHGLSSVSGFLTSPTVGGQSWLPSGTFVSGLWLADQGRYDIAMQSDWLTLTRAFNRAGYRTVALKPAITAPWPEGERFGFTRLYLAADLGYAGKPYNWVTMPDQYTLSALERVERNGARGSPLFAEVSLISSHAPWTPVAEVLEDWESIGDGRVFSTWADSGEPPHVVWSDPARIRVWYPRTIDYVLRVLASYSAKFVDDRTLVMLVGDHQPSPVATGGDVGHDVPIHVISGNPELLEPFKRWGLVPGMRPSPDRPVRRMDTFRNFFLDAFQRPVETAAVH
jgi:phosphatidylglycerophosphate synthase